MHTAHQKRAALAALYQRLERHIRDNESRYRLGDEPVAKAMRRMSNAQFLEVEIGRLLRERGFSTKGPTARTLIRVFERGGFSVQANNRTLDAIARVVGARDFRSFVREGDFPTRAPEAAAPPPQERAEEPAEEPAEEVPPRRPAAPPEATAPLPPRRRATGSAVGWVLAGAALVGVLAYAVGGAREDGRPGPAPGGAPSGAIAAEVARLVDEHNAVGLRLYRSLPDLADTAALQASTWADGPAYREVVRIAAGHVARGNRPLPRRMNRQLLDAEVLAVRDTVARVQTQEHWTLNFLQPDGRVYKYDQTNFQLYTLRRRGPQWRVWANAYAGEGEVVESNGAVPVE